VSLVAFGKKWAKDKKFYSTEQAVLMMLLEHSTYKLKFKGSNLATNGNPEKIA
jgi:hypothetical protein